MEFAYPINVTSATLSLTKDHAGGVITVNRAAGSTLTLPTATGSGRHYKIFVGTTITSNNLVVQVTTTDTMSGQALLAQDAADTAVFFETAADSDTITMNGTTKGGTLGDMIELIDVASAKWSVFVRGAATGTEVTPFSAAVS